MTDDLAAIHRAAAALGDPYAALSQHMHGDGDASTSETRPARPMPNAAILICRVRPRPPRACATPGCTNPSVIRLDDSHLCRDCYATHDFGDDA